MKKIILYGGSFDPIHNGHIKIAKNAIKKINADKVFFIPTFISPNNKEYRTSWKDRVRMLEIALEKYKKFEICKFEGNKNEISYSWKTVREFKNKFKNSQLFFLVGADQYLNLKNWKNIDYILNNCKIICNSRNDISIEKDNFLGKDNFIFINLNIDISSTESILNPKKKIDSNVINYINENSIYAIYRIKEYLKTSQRVSHSIEVANLAKEFVKNKNKNLIKKAYCAGIYHDIAKEIPKNILIENAEKILNYRNYPSWKVIHGPMGKYIMKNIFLFNDNEILDAVFYHSIPKKNPNELEKIIFCADKLSYREDRETNDKIIKICKKDINKGYRILLKLNQEWIKK